MSVNQIVISEVLPDPIGRDTENEWIELANLGDQPVSLAGFTLDDIEGGSKPYTLPQIDLAAGEHYLLPRSQTKLALNNTGAEMVRLFDSTGQLIDSVEFADLPQGLALAREADGTYRLTSRTTPGNANDFDTQKFTGQLIASDTAGFTLDTAEQGATTIQYDTDEVSILAQAILPAAGEWQVYARTDEEALILTEFSLPADYAPAAQTIPAVEVSSVQMLLLLVLLFSLAAITIHKVLRGDFPLLKKLISH